jgi:glycerophosphoryl diester phosphodiesterase
LFFIKTCHKNTSFYKEQIVRFNKIAQGSVAIGASQQEVTEAFLKYHLLGGRFG